MVLCCQVLCTVALLGLLCSCQGSLFPRTSFSMGTPGRVLAHFNGSDIRNTTTLLLSDDGNTLYVGARDAVLSLDVSKHGVMELRDKLDWMPSAEDSRNCHLTGKKEMDCHNFIRVLQFLNASHMFACGTFAFNPLCTYIAPTFKLHPKPEQVKGSCPFDPYLRNTAVVVDGELYVGTMEDFRGTQPAISRYLSQENRCDLKLEGQPGWLDDPTFISSTYISSEKKVYYFLTETGTEYTFSKKILVSRVAQVCTDDVGGKLILQKRWTTFAKAKLLCQSEKDLPFNILQDMATLSPPDGSSPDEMLFYGVFSHQWSLTSGQSAVCIFRLGDIKKVFSGQYMELNRNRMTWSPRNSKQMATPGMCGLEDSSLNFVKENFLAKDSVQSIHGPVLVSPGQRYSRVAAQRTQAADGHSYTVLYLLTESGFLHKVVLLEKGPHIIEEVQVFKEPQAVKNILLSITKGVVFVGSSEGVFQVPVSNCSFYWSCAQCVLARDPFCGWDPVQGVCTEWSNTNRSIWQDLEEGNVTKICTEVKSRKSQSSHQDQPTEQKYVILHNTVELSCPKSSNLASVHWERSDGQQLSKTIYLQLSQGGLRFLATTHTLGEYRCISVENRHKETLARVRVTQRASPRSNAQGNTASCADTALDNESFGEACPRKVDRSYYGEMVGVSILLVLSLCLLVVAGLYVWQLRTQAKATHRIILQERDRGSLS